MKRRLSLLVAMIMAALVILSAVPAMAEKTVITYWSNDRHDETYMTEMINKFNESHDDIEINMVIMTDDFENSILLAIDGGTAPDIVGQAVTLKNMVDYNAVVDLTPYIQADEDIPDPYGGSLADYNNVYEHLKNYVLRLSKILSLEESRLQQDSLQ